MKSIVVLSLFLLIVTSCEASLRGNPVVYRHDDYNDEVNCGQGTVLKVALNAGNKDNCVNQGPDDGRCGTEFTVHATKNDKDGSVYGILRKQVWEFDEETVLAEVDITCLDYVVVEGSDVEVYVGGYIINHPDPSVIGTFGFTALSGGTMDGNTPTIWPATSCEEAMEEFVGVRNLETTREIPQLQEGNLKLDRC